MRSVLVTIALFLVLTPSPEASKEDEQLAAGLRHLLDMKNTPNISLSRQDIPRYILNMYKQKVSTELLGRRSFYPHLSSNVRIYFPKDIHQKTNGFHLQFNLSTVCNHKTEEIRNAELHVHVHSRVDRSFQVRILYLMQQQKTKTIVSEDGSSILSQELKQTTKNRWMVLNLTRSINPWLTAGSLKNFELVISSSEELGITSKGKRKPFLVLFSHQDGLFTEKLKKQRFAAMLGAKEETIGSRNSPGVTDMLQQRTKRSQLNICEHKRLFVRFRDLPWNNWIIAPARFGFHYCEGSCPASLTMESNPTNHAILQNILHRKFNRKIPVATCVPTELRSTSFLYYDTDNAIVLKSVPGMVASACGCR